MSKPEPRTPEPSRYFYGWSIVGMVFVANFVTAGTSFYLMNAFMEPLCELRGWSRTEVNIAPMLATLVFLACNLVYGALVMRFGPRIMMTIGAMVGGVAFALMGRAESLWAFYLLFMLLAMGNGAFGEMVASTAVNNWWVRKLGRAMGLATTGKSLSGAILPVIAMVMLFKYELPQVFMVIGLFMIVMGPVAWLVIRNWPEDLGLVPDGIADSLLHPGIKTEGVPPDPVMALPKAYTLSQLIRTGTFWKLGIAFSLGLLSLVGVMSQLKPRFSDIGFDDMTAMLMMAATALVGAVGKYVWGYLCERFDSGRVFAVMMFTCGFGLSLALVKDSLPVLILFIIVFGFAVGGILSAFFVLIGDFYGRFAFPSVLRYLTVFSVIQLAGFFVAGQSYDRFGSYDAAYIFFAVCNILAGLLILTARRPQPLIVPNIAAVSTRSDGDPDPILR